ncbi:DUF1987 domain-containing protein [Microscilla marina]|uniref:SiaC family regulatory phosphoprotein domain-containing protein n=1 Tax=Microscilla marina ATCC 23134 TaxID=313606 RepID=A1ZXH7_MICM2|nr:DUF1987 domain-containing protein [Microscilla marina]EAY24945.1 conserved hypothetical protein [Microscilla marina ATCC 23134]
MRNFFIAEKHDTPQVSFDANTKVFEISGESFSEYSMDFYLPIIQWIDAYTKQYEGPITFNFKLLYYNTGSSQRLLEIMQMLDQYHNSGKGQVKINWYSLPEEYRMIEAGEDYQATLKVPFEIIEQDFEAST